MCASPQTYLTAIMAKAVPHVTAALVCNVILKKTLKLPQHTCPLLTANSPGNKHTIHFLQTELLSPFDSNYS